MRLQGELPLTQHLPSTYAVIWCNAMLSSAGLQQVLVLVKTDSVVERRHDQRIVVLICLCAEARKGASMHVLGDPHEKHAVNYGNLCEIRNSL